eukprot:TRINITY_DN6826_c0_g3_i1.p1 TRINITY_DN6826_c0_g3~~TRINITY_DN6826_c0_g3_i1.p1  ORF type:complete len:319 (+),score=58.74 TRINITY_DN6826_c0_g3_i1:248-1204(+)
MSGEAMLALWSALKSVLRPGDHVLSVANGVYGKGIAEMAKSLQCEVVVLECDWQTSVDPAVVIEAIYTHRPHLVTMVHCETPSGLLNRLDGIGAAAASVNALFYVDFVSSAGSCPIHPASLDSLHIDLGLLGSQKVLSCPADLAILFVSPRAWQVVEQVRYIGYDALLPFRSVTQHGYFPYTPNWHALRAVARAVKLLLQEEGEEGKRELESVWARHLACKNLCRRLAGEMGLELYITDEESAAPSVTAIRVPSDIPWPAFDRALRHHGLVVGGSYDKLAGHVFRIGHMGSQAQLALVEQAMRAVSLSLQELRSSSNN